MKTYTEEFKAKIVARLLPPNNCRMSDLIRETGIPGVTLRAWRTKYGGLPEVSDATSKGVDSFTSATKFQHVVESATLNEYEIGEFCRRRGIFQEQLAAWRNACLLANEHHPNRKDRTEKRELLRQINQLEGELRRKEKALSEAAALLMLQKKVRAIWEVNGDVNLNYRSDVQ